MAKYKPNKQLLTRKAPSKYGDIIFGSIVKLAAIISLLIFIGIIVSLLVAAFTKH